MILPSLRQLRFLVALADELHFGHAAEACNVTQSTLSTGIMELEALLGAPLAERTKRRVLMTPLGEDIAARAHRAALRAAHRTLLIIAPRHPERGPAIAQTLRDEGWNVALRSAGQDIMTHTQIFVADTLGEMGLWYRLAPISFMGGSLAEIGGHNPFEPAALGSAILHGPHVSNFIDIYDRLTHAGAAELVKDTDQLSEALRRLQSPDEAARMAHAAWEVSSTGAEVTDWALDLILDTLDRNPPKTAQVRT